MKQALKRAIEQLKAKLRIGSSSGSVQVPRDAYSVDEDEVVTFVPSGGGSSARSEQEETPGVTLQVNKYVHPLHRLKSSLNAGLNIQSIDLSLSECSSQEYLDYISVQSKCTKEEEAFLQAFLSVIKDRENPDYLEPVVKELERLAQRNATPSRYRRFVITILLCQYHQASLKHLNLSHTLKTSFFMQEQLYVILKSYASQLEELDMKGLQGLHINEGVSKQHEAESCFGVLRNEASRLRRLSLSSFAGQDARGGARRVWWEALLSVIDACKALCDVEFLMVCGEDAPY